MSTILIALLALQLKHYVFDYLLQSPYQYSNKGSYGHPGGLIHAGLHALGSIPALLILAVPFGLLVALVVGEFVVHYHLDWTKAQIARKFNFNDTQQGYWAIFGADQLAHQLTYVAILAIARP
jgi:Protein of unknown function (DUF3307)